MYECSGKRGRVDIPFMAILRRATPCHGRLSAAWSRNREAGFHGERVGFFLMKHHRVSRTALLALAIAFLAISWVWDALAAVARRLVVVIPWRRVKAVVAAVVDRLPAPLALLVFLVPFLIVEPLLVVATVAIAMGYVFWGAVAWIILKFLAIAVIPAIFDLTKHRLMTMPWFVWAFDKVMAFHHYADRIVAPYKHAAQALVRTWRQRAGALIRRSPGIAQRASRFAARVARRRNGEGRASLTHGE